MYLLTNIEFVSGHMDIVVCCFLSCPFLTFQCYSDQICHQQLLVVMRYAYYADRITKLHCTINLCSIKYIYAYNSTYVPIRSHESY